MAGPIFTLLRHHARVLKAFETEKLRRFYMWKLPTCSCWKLIGTGLETKKQIHATYSGRLPSAFHLDVLLTSRCLMLSQRKNVVFSTRKKTFESPKDVLHGRPLILCPVMAPFSPCFALVEQPYLKLKASKQKLRRFYVGAQFVFVGNGLETKTYSFMKHIQAGCLQRFILIYFSRKIRGQICPS